MGLSGDLDRSTLPGSSHGRNGLDVSGYSYLQNETESFVSYSGLKYAVSLK